MATCEPLPTWGYPLGIMMGVAGSIGINVGQNVQASGLQALPVEQHNKPHLSRLWQIGLVIFVLFSLINFAALALAPASVLTPLESIQFVTNVVWNRMVNHKVVSRRMLTGVSLSLVGTVLSVIFGAQPSACHSHEQLQQFWTAPAWWIYLVVTVGIAAAAFSFHALVTRREERGEALPPHAALLLPVSYTLSSALVGGAQMIVHSKVVSELLALLFQGGTYVFGSWLLYVELLLVTGCGIVWAWRLTACLVLYDPLLILPLMVGTYILFGGIAGGLYFNEFSTLHLGPGGHWRWLLYLGGMALVLYGLYLIADASAPPAVKPVRSPSDGSGSKAADAMPFSAGSNGGKQGRNGICGCEDWDGISAPTTAPAAAPADPYLWTPVAALGDDGGAASAKPLTAVKELSIEVLTDSKSSLRSGSPLRSAERQRRTSRGIELRTDSRGSLHSRERGQRRSSRERKASRDRIELLSSQENRLRRVSREYDAASAMPVPAAIMYSSAKLVAVREQLATERQVLAESLRDSPSPTLDEEDEESGNRVSAVDFGPGSPRVPQTPPTPMEQPGLQQQQLRWGQPATAEEEEPQVVEIAHEI